MHRIGLCLIVLVTACGSSGDGAEESGGGSGGAADSGTAGAPGSGGAMGTGGTTGSGGAKGTGGTTGSGGRADADAGGATGGGGSAATGGSTGAGGARDAAVVVRACNGLPAAGQWEDITPTVFHTPSNMETMAIVVSPLDQTVYAAAGNVTNGGKAGTGVYKSTDCGATFSLATTGTNADKLATGDPWAILMDPTNPNTLYMDNGYGNDPTLYKSTNAGVDWTALEPHPVWKQRSFVQAIAMDPANPQHLALTFHQNCEAPYSPMCLSRSNDGGATWLVFNGPSSLTGWQEGVSLTVLGPTSYLVTGPFGGGLWYTPDEGKTWNKVASDNFDGSYAGSTNTVPDGTLYVAGANGIYKSNSNPLGSAFTKIAGSPKATVLVNDGVSLYASFGWAYGGNPVWTAKLTDTTKWTNMIHTGRGANQVAYDSAHHIVYAANWANGLWRLVTR